MLIFADGTFEGVFNSGWTWTNVAAMVYALKNGHGGTFGANSGDGVLHVKHANLATRSNVGAACLQARKECRMRMLTATQTNLEPGQ